MIDEKESALDQQQGGDHYKKYGKYQPWQVFEKWLSPEELKGYMKGTTIAYLAREDDKGGREDIRKAMHTMQLYLELTEAQYKSTEEWTQLEPGHIISRFGDDKHRLNFWLSDSQINITCIKDTHSKHHGWEIGSEYTVNAFEYSLYDQNDNHLTQPGEE